MNFTGNMKKEEYTEKDLLRHARSPFEISPEYLRSSKSMKHHQIYPSKRSMYHRAWLPRHQRHMMPPRLPIPYNGIRKFPNDLPSNDQIFSLRTDWFFVPMPLPIPVPIPNPTPPPLPNINVT